MSIRFSVALGNPAYQVDKENTSDAPVYNYFMDAAYGIADQTIMITPARFLFRNGKTPKEWNEKMLADEHFKVECYEPDSKKIFPNADIKGGIAVHYRNPSRSFGAIKTFTAYSELNSILQKVQSTFDKSLADIIYPTVRFNLDSLLSDYPEAAASISSDGKEKRMTSGCFALPVFTEEKRSETDYCILGVIANKRVYRYIPAKYVEVDHPNLAAYKVILPGNNGSGAIGEVLSTPLIGTPLIGYTQTFISIGAFETREEAENCLKYVKSKFCRTMLGILKITQNGKKEMWRYVPLQSFSSSDINWSLSIPEIDKQLYQKYGLDEEEIAFVESHIKEMS